MDMKALKDVLEHLILPALTLSTIPWRFWLELLAALCWKYYHKTTSAPQGQGLLERWVIFKHALKMLYCQWSQSLACSSAHSWVEPFSETIFSWPGIGLWI